MRQSLLRRRLKRRLGYYVPALCVLLPLLLATTPLRVAHVNDVALALVMMAIYYWGLLRPVQMPHLLVFLCGLLYDLMSGMPLGLSSVSWLLLRILVQSYGRLFATGTFWGVWAGYLITSAVSVLVRWGMLSWYNEHGLPAGPTVQFWLAASACYPLAHLVFAWMYKSLELDRASKWRHR